MIRCSKFRKSRLVPLHETARSGLERYLQQRLAYAPAEPHVFVSLRRKPLLLHDVEVAFRTAARAIGLPDSPRGRLRYLSLACQTNTYLIENTTDQVVG